MDNSKPPCKCCGLPTDVDSKDLCFYCYARSGMGTAKYLVFKAILDNGNRAMTIDEILEATNKLRGSIDVRPVKKGAVKKILLRYSEFYEESKIRGSGYLLLVGKMKILGSKKPLNTYRLSAALVRRMESYERRWKTGLPMNIRNKNGKKFNMFRPEYQQRARAIMFRTMRAELSFYDFMLYDQKLNTNPISSFSDSQEQSQSLS